MIHTQEQLPGEQEHEEQVQPEFPQPPIMMFVDWTLFD